MRKKRFAVLACVLSVMLLLSACAGVDIKLTFKVDGKTYQTVKTTGKDAIKMPKDPVKEGYVFDGWYWDNDVWEKPFTVNSLLETPLTENMTVYAKWKKEAEEHVHSYGEWTVVTAATCTAEGTEKRVCECGEAETRTTEKLPHSFGEWTEVTPSTCTAEGTEKRVCECGEAETRTTEKLPHSFGEWTVVTPSTCTAEGTEKRVCSVCGEKETKTVELKAHDYITKYDEGNHWKECSVCSDKKDKAAHTFVNDVCTVCGRFYETGLAYRKIDGGYELAGIGNAEGGDIVIPSTYKGEPVIAIASYAFENCDRLKSVKIPSSVTSIGNSAFKGCNGLTKAEISDLAVWCGVAFEDEDANPLKYAKHLYLNGAEITELEIPDGIERIADYTFYGCDALIGVTIPNSVTAIGSGTFSFCGNLTSIIIPFGVTEIGRLAFNACNGLTIYAEAAEKPSGWYDYFDCPIVWDYNNNEVADDEYVYTIQDGIRYGIKKGAATVVGQPKNIEAVNIPTEISYKGSTYRVESIGNNAFGYCERLTSVVIPNSVKTIDFAAFAFCRNLISVEIPSSVTSINELAFVGCVGLTGLVIPSSVTTIGHMAFVKCDGLESLTVEKGNPIYHSAGNCIIETNTKTLIAGCKNSTIPTDGSVTSIGNEAFMYCVALTSIDIPLSITSIGSYAFTGCYNLESAEIPSSVVSIGNGVFSECRSLKSVHFGSGVTEIRADTLDGCVSLTSLSVSNGNQRYYSDKNCIVETATKTLVRGCNTSVIPTNGSVTSIESGAFYGCGSLTSIVIPKVITSIGVNAFGDCGSLETIVVEKGNPIYHSAENCIIETQTKTLIAGCKNSVIPTDGSVTAIGNYAFADVSGLTDIVIPEGVTIIGWGAFRGCGNLESVRIPKSLTEIGHQSFEDCGSLKNFRYDGKKGEWRKIIQSDSWYSDTGNFTVTCLDGVLKKAEVRS